MDIKEAIDKIWNENKYQDKSIRRKAWKNDKYKIKLELRGRLTDWAGNDASIDAIDLFEDDWEIIE